MIRRLALFSAITGCSLVVPLGDLGPGGDASIDVTSDVVAEGSVDAGVVCDFTKPFTTFRALTELESKGDDNHATLSPDELQIWFASDRFSDANQRDIYTAKRQKRTDPFGPISIVTEISTSRDDSQPSISADLLTMLFATLVNGIQWDIFIATRATASDPFGPPASVVGVNMSSTDWMPTFSGDQKTLYFSSDRGGDANVWAWSYGSAQAPAQVAGIDTASTDQRQCLSSDELLVYWASNRPDLDHIGGLDVFVANRAQKTDAFGNARIVTELSTTSDENADWLSPDLCRLYVHSNRSIGMGGDDLYIAERVP